MGVSWSDCKGTIFGSFLLSLGCFLRLPSSSQCRSLGRASGSRAVRAGRPRDRFHVPPLFFWPPSIHLPTCRTRTKPLMSHQLITATCAIGLPLGEEKTKQAMMKTRRERKNLRGLRDVSLILLTMRRGLFLFALLLFIVLPWVLPESQAFVTNLHVPVQHSATFGSLPFSDRVGTHQPNSKARRPASVSHPPLLFRRDDRHVITRRSSSQTNEQDVERIRNSSTGFLSSISSVLRRRSSAEGSNINVLRQWLFPFTFASFLVGVMGLLWNGPANAVATTSLPALRDTPILPALPSWMAAETAGVVVVLGGLLLNLASSGTRIFVEWYMANLSANPIVTKSVTAGIIGLVGDYFAQWSELLLFRRKERKPSIERTRNGKVDNMAELLSIKGNYHFRRGLSVLADGVIISGPLMHFGYDLFERIIPVAATSASASSFAALAQVVADSVILDSIFVATTFVVTGLMEGYSFRQLVPQFRLDYVPSLKMSWVTSLAMLPAEFLCFRYLPLSFRVLAVNFLDVVWDGVISFMAHRSRKEWPGAHQLVEEVVNDGPRLIAPVANPVYQI